MNDEREWFVRVEGAERMKDNMDALNRAFREFPSPSGPFGQIAKKSNDRLERKRARVGEIRLRGDGLPLLNDVVRVGREVLELSEEECDVELMIDELGK